MSRNHWQVQAIPFGSRFSPDLLKKQTASPNLIDSDIQYWRYAWLYRCWWVSSLDDRSNTSNAKHLSPSFKYWIWISKYWTTTAAGAAQYWFLCIWKKDARPKGRPFFRFIDVWDLFPYIVCSMYIDVSQIQSDCVTNSKRLCHKFKAIVSQIQSDCVTNSKFSFHILIFNSKIAIFLLFLLIQKLAIIINIQLFSFTFEHKKLSISSILDKFRKGWSIIFNHFYQYFNMLITC